MFSTVGPATNVNTIDINTTAPMEGVSTTSTTTPIHHRCAPTPPPRSRFLAFGDSIWRPTVTELSQNNSQACHGSGRREGEGRGESSSVETVPKSRRFWDVVLNENEHNPMAGKQPMYPRIPFPHDTERLPLPQSMQSGDSPSSHSHSSSGTSQRAGATSHPRDYQFPSREEIERRRDKSIKQMMDRTRKELERLTRVAEAFQRRPARMHVDEARPSVAPGWVFDPFEDVVEDEGEGHPFVYYHERRVNDEVRFVPPPIPACPLPAPSSTSPFIFHPIFDIDLVERSMLCPRPPPPPPLSYYFPQAFYARPVMIPSSHY